MIIFHEGLPGSGKSYEAALNQIIPALKKGRKVFAYIEGLNHQKFSEVSGIELDKVKSLLVQLEKDQVFTVYEHVENDSLVILDELQDFWPSVRSKLDEKITEFVTQHRHRGIDIVCMGQDHRDCHLLWKRRIDTLLRFVKRDAIGRKNDYTWTSHKQNAGKFEQLRSGKGSYDPANFGLYASHSDGVESIDAHEDDRTNILKSAAFTTWLPLFGLVLLYAIYYIWGFFHKTPEKLKTPVVVSSNHRVIRADDFQKQKPKEQTIKPPVVKKNENEYFGYVDRFFEKYRPRLGSYVVFKSGEFMAYIDFYEGDRVQYRLNLQQLYDFGYKAELKSFGILFTKGSLIYPVISWPLDNQRNVPDMIRPQLIADAVS